MQWDNAYEKTDCLYNENDEGIHLPLGAFSVAIVDASSCFKIIVSCEHASHAVPAVLEYLFSGAEGVLNSHRAWDVGAQDMAHCLASHWDAPLFSGKITRLVCDLNRSETNPGLWSEWSRHLSSGEKKACLEKWYYPYWKAVKEAVEQNISDSEAGSGVSGSAQIPLSRIVHFSVHSFTPLWKGQERKVDLGLLYDPSRREEASLALALQSTLARIMPSLRVRRNVPYRGVSDGLTTALRKYFSSGLYSGMELEFNQGGRFPIVAFRETLGNTFIAAMEELFFRR